jgi:hypothetical protein
VALTEGPAVALTEGPAVALTEGPAVALPAERLPRGRHLGVSVRLSTGVVHTGDE